MPEIEQWQPCIDTILVFPCLVWKLETHTACRCNVGSPQIFLTSMAYTIFQLGEQQYGLVVMHAALNLDLHNVLQLKFQSRFWIHLYTIPTDLLGDGLCYYFPASRSRFWKFCKYWYLEAFNRQSSLVMSWWIFSLFWFVPGEDQTLSVLLFSTAILYLDKGLRRGRLAEFPLLLLDCFELFPLYKQASVLSFFA